MTDIYFPSPFVSNIDPWFFFLLQILTEKLVPKLSASNSKPRVIIVSSGGMLTNKMDFQDLNFEKMAPFDGTMAYAQNKRQQVKYT